MSVIPSIKRNRGWLLAGIAATVAALLVPTLPALAADTSTASDESCELEQLPKPDNSGYVHLAAMDSTASHFAIVHVNGEGQHLYLYRDGEPEHISIDDTDAELLDVNSSGAAVGYYRSPSTRLITPFVYEDGEVRDLELPDDNAGGGRATSINDEGMIGGEVIDANNKRWPAYWPTADETGIELDAPDAASAGWVRDIAEDGRIVGQSEEGARVYRPLMWDADGNTQPFPGVTADFQGYPTSISGEYIAGQRTADGIGSILWTGEEEPVKVEGFGAIREVNAAGSVVGDTSAGGHAAYKHLDGEMVRLPNLEQGRDQGQSISEDGATIAGNIGANRSDHNPVRWNCA